MLLFHSVKFYHTLPKKKSASKSNTTLTRIWYDFDPNLVTPKNRPKVSNKIIHYPQNPTPQTDTTIPQKTPTKI